MQNSQLPELVRDLARGRDESTPALALAGVGVVVGAVVALLVIVAFLAFYVMR